MAYITLQLLEGLERGQVLENLPTPVTIGREEENTLRLNDERVSRFHAKIQEDAGKLILTDLDSTNGTRVNGHPIQMRILKFGDQIAIGRCLMVFGSEQEIAERAEEVLKERGTLSDSGDHTVAGKEGRKDSGVRPPGGSRGDVHRDDDGRLVELFPEGPPDPPKGLRPAQSAEVSDFIAYCHDQVRRVLLAASEVIDEDSYEVNDTEDRTIQVDWLEWQRLLKVEMQMAAYMRRIADPDAK